jgi:predicted esterase
MMMCNLLGVATLLPWILAPAALSALGDETPGDSPADQKAIEQAINAGPAEEKAAASREFAGYDEMRSAVVDLYGQQRYAEAASILTAALDRYPDHVGANAYNLGLMYAAMDSLDQAVCALEDGHRRGIFYGKWSFQQGPWEVFSGHESFQRFLARNEELITEAQKRAVMKLEVVTPPGYDEGRRYPLFVALHGGGENLEQFKPKWTSPRLREEFVVAYVQSTQVADMDGYHWEDDAITRRELGEAYREVAAKYAIDTLRVLYGGFSSGGYGTLLTLFDGALPASGFVILCPEVPADPSEDAMETAVRRGVRGTLLTTEQDRRLERQKEYAAQLTAHGLDVRCVVTANIGHWYPDDLGRLIDEALAHIWPEP